MKIEQRLGSKAVGPPPLIMTILWICSGYSWAKNVQKDTLCIQNVFRIEETTRVETPNTAATAMHVHIEQASMKNETFQCTNSRYNTCYGKTYEIQVALLEM